MDPAFWSSLSALLGASVGGAISYMLNRQQLRNHLGGFADDELRKILVRAGAIRVYREDGSEWWRLLSRMDEYIERKQLDQIAREI